MDLDKKKTVDEFMAKYAKDFDTLMNNFKDVFRKEAEPVIEDIADDFDPNEYDDFEDFPDLKAPAEDFISDRLGEICDFIDLDLFAEAVYKKMGLDNINIDEADEIFEAICNKLNEHYICGKLLEESAFDLIELAAAGIEDTREEDMYESRHPYESRGLNRNDFF